MLEVKTSEAKKYTDEDLAASKKQIDDLVKNNTNDIVDDFDYLEVILRNLELNQPKEKKICLHIPVTITFEWESGVNGHTYNDTSEKTLYEALAKIEEGFLEEMTNNINLWLYEADGYAQKHNIEIGLFSHYFFRHYI
jgi:hypothetical protein